ncbi:hypothetical protein BH10ACT2_BH10ACT2_03460 [soil metagenome]
MRNCVVAVCLLATVASSCSGSSDTSTTTASTSDCDSATPIVLADEGATEVQGVAKDATIYGLTLLTHIPPIHSGDEVKIVWRMTGEGELAVTYESPSGEPADLLFGPERHGSSSYGRPGLEWGTGFLFDEPGCWHIHLERAVGAGDVWINVVKA